MSTTSTKKPEQAALLEVAASEMPEREEQAKSSARYASPRPFREWTPEQGQLLPQYAREVQGEGHLACFFVEVREGAGLQPHPEGVHPGARPAALDDAAAHVRVRAGHYEQPGD